MQWLAVPWNMGIFYGNSYFVDPKGKIIVEGSEDNDELIIGEFDLNFIREVRTD